MRREAAAGGTLNFISQFKVTSLHQLDSRCPFQCCDCTTGSHNLQHCCEKNVLTLPKIAIFIQQSIIIKHKDKVYFEEYISAYHHQC